MKNTLMCCAALAAALSLLLCACGTPAGPAAATTAADLSAFVTAFDLSDLSQFLTEPQLANLEAAVRETLTSQGYAPESFTLQFDDPAEGSTKLPFDNAGGLDLARLDIRKLAEYIVGMIIAHLNDRGIAIPAVATTGTAKATASTTITTTTTQAPTTLKPTTTTKTTAKPATSPSKQEMYPQELLLADNQIVDIGGVGSGNRAFSNYANGGFNLAIPANDKTYLFRRADDLNKRAYYENQFKAGTKETVGLYVKTGQRDGKAVFRQIGTYDFTVEVPAGSIAGYVIDIVPDRNDTMRYSDYPDQLFYKSVSVRVGRNNGMPFTYWVHPDYYIIPDSQTIFLN